MTKHQCPIGDSLSSLVIGIWSLVILSRPSLPIDLPHPPALDVHRRQPAAAVTIDEDGKRTTPPWRVDADGHGTYRAGDSPIVDSSDGFVELRRLGNQGIEVSTGHGNRLQVGR